MAKVFAYAGGYLDCDGGTAIDPIVCADILAADVAGGWGVFTNPGTGVYKCTAGQLRFGQNSVTFFEMASELLFFDGAGTQKLRARPNATLTLTNSGIWIYSTGNDWSLIEGTTTATRCTFRADYRINWKGTATLTDCNQPSGNTWIDSANITLVRCYVGKLYLSDPLGAGSQDNVFGYVEGNTGGPLVELRGGEVLGQLRLYNCPLDVVDCAFDDTNLKVDPNGGPLRERYTFARAALQSSGAACAGATVLDKNEGGDTEFTYETNANGLPDAEQLLTAREWVYSGTPASPTLTDHNPFTLTVEKNGYEPYSEVATIDNPQEDAIALLARVPRVVAGLEHSVESAPTALTHELNPVLTLEHAVAA